MLLGRRSVCAALDELMHAVRAGQSRVLVLRGEPGVGKAALLEYVADPTSGFRFTRFISWELDSWSVRA
jgi:predicted ATPase